MYSVELQPAKTSHVFQTGDIFKMEVQDGYAIVLFSHYYCKDGDGAGSVLFCEGKFYKQGEFKTDWPMRGAELFYGTIIINTQCLP